MNLPPNAPAWPVPHTKASRQMLQNLPFSLVGFREISEAMEKDNHKDILRSGQSSGPVHCTA